jgi:hypothetical protein
MAAAPALLLGATALSTVATGASAVAGYQQGQAGAAADRYNAKVAASEAATVQQQATGAEWQERARARDFLGNAVATSAETGVGLSGSRAQVLGQSAEDAEYQALLTRYKGKLDAQGLTAQSSLLKTQAANAKTFGNEALFTGLVGAGAQGLAGYGRYKLGPGAQFNSY